MILNIDNPMALPSESEGLRSSGGNSKEGTDGGLFGEILNSQEVVSPPVDDVAELLLPFGRDTTGGTLLPGGGKQLPQLAGSESDAGSLEAVSTLPSSVAALLQVVPADGEPLNGEPLNNVEELISLLPDDLSRLEQNLEIEGTLKLSALEQASGGPKINDPAPQPLAALAPLPNGLEAAIANPTAVGLANARDPLLSSQVPGQNLELDARGDKIASSRFGPVVDSQVPIAQKVDMAIVAQDISTDSTEALKSLDGLLAKTVGSSPAGSAPLPPGIAQNVSEASLPSGAKATSLPAMSTAVGDPKWGDDFAGRIGILVDKGVSEAKLQLTPAELGRLEIKISTDGDQAKILFTVQNAAAREAIEQAMPRLREMLGQDGLQLAHSEVADQSASQDNNRNLNPENLTLDTGGSEEEIDDFLPRSVTVTADTMVDYYV